MIVQYLRNNKNHRVGVLVAVKFENRILYGWSLACKLDKFDRDRGIEIAKGRALASDVKDRKEEDERKIPHQVLKEMPEFQKRAERYYKDVVR